MAERAWPTALPTFRLTSGWRDEKTKRQAEKLGQSATLHSSAQRKLSNSQDQLSSTRYFGALKKERKTIGCQPFGRRTVLVRWPSLSRSCLPACRRVLADRGGRAGKAVAVRHLAVPPSKCKAAAPDILLSLFTCRIPCARRNMMLLRLRVGTCVHAAR